MLFFFPRAFFCERTTAMFFKPEITPEFENAWRQMEAGPSWLFITGKAGTGKSTLLNHFRKNTQKKVAVLAPTGVAALNVHGQTLHSFFGFKPDVTLKAAQECARRVRREGEDEIYQELEILVIDEVSMVRADLLDCIDKFLRVVRKRRWTPFGGIRIVFIGDLYQLPPVVTPEERQLFREHYASPYFFDAKVMAKVELEIVELEKIYRQKDRRFIDLLNAVRNNTLDSEQLDWLNQRYAPDFEPEAGLYVYLTATNDRAATINSKRLAQLGGKSVTLMGSLEGNFDPKNLPTEMNLQIKVGAQVMLVSNHPDGLWVNGSMAQVVSLPQGEKIAVTVKLEDGGLVEVYPNQWDLFRYQFDAKKKVLTTETLGTFRQYPLRLAWALTIHKSQGKTFDHVVLDTGRGLFAPGQMYVALSRCRRLEGLVLNKLIAPQEVFVDWRVAKFMTRYRYLQSEAAMPLEQKRALIERAISDGRELAIVYLKPSDEKSFRTLRPLRVGEVQYSGRNFLGLRAHCQGRKAERTFRLDRILEIQVL